MLNLRYSKILKMNKEIQSSLRGNKYEIVVLSNIIVSPIKEILEYPLRVQDINAYVKFGDYDNILQDSKKFKDSNLIIIFWELPNIVDGLQYKANLMDEVEVINLISKVKSEIDFVISNFKETSLVLINKFSSLIFNYQNLKQNNFDSIAKELNRHLEQKTSLNIILIDIDKVIAKISVEKSVDLRYYYSSKALYTIEFFKEYSYFIKPIILSSNGKSKKALIFDCDNTLWKGILGEDGYDGIEMSNKTRDGIIFEEVQSIALDLSKKGILIGICSKNNPKDVDELIDNHPDMKIKEENIAIKKVNWNDKVANLKAIAKELNIGIDSMVFIDDTDFEVNYIKKYLPQVTVLQVPSKLYEYPRVLRENLGILYNISESDEDLKRIQMYKEQRQRESLKNNFETLEDYLKSLDLKLNIFVNDNELIPRIAQITQKTNQFNLTTKRYTEIDIKHFIKSDDWKVFAFDVEDRFGKYGVTGFAGVKINMNEQKAEIDTFLMSCRVIGRNIEFAFFDFIISYLNNLHISSIYGEYIKTLKNEQVKEFYESLGFKTIFNSEDRKNYELKVADYKPKNLAYIRVQYGK